MLVAVVLLGGQNHSDGHTVEVALLELLLSTLHQLGETGYGHALIDRRDQASMTRQPQQAPGANWAVLSSALPADRGVRRLVRCATDSSGGIASQSGPRGLSFRCRLLLPWQGERAE